MAVYALPAQSLSVVFVADCVLMYCMSSDDLLPLVQGYGVELPVHRPPHLPTGRASTRVVSDQVQLIFVYGVCCNADMMWWGALLMPVNSMHGLVLVQQAWLMHIVPLC